VKIAAISKVDQVREAILVEIALGNLQPGERLYEVKLSRELGVSQATVNAALQDLHSQGVVTKLLNRSTNVNRYTLEDVRKLFEVRLALEPVAAAAVAARWSGDAEGALIERIDAMRTAALRRDAGHWSIADFRFHQEVFRQSSNRFLIQAGQAIAAVPFVYILCEELRGLPSDDYAMMTDEHHAQIAALAQGPEVARRVSREFILRWLRWLVDADHSQPDRHNADAPLSGTMGG
jgi:DNA-binding GntR family transcriptional regulator